MRGADRCFTTALILVSCFGASLSHAQLAVSVTGPGEFAPADTVAATFQVQGILDALNNNLTDETGSATISMEVALWRRKSTWWDKLVSSYTVEYDMKHDVLTRKLIIEEADQRRIFASTTDFQAFIEEPREVILGRPESFVLGKSYYVTVHVVVESNLDKVDAWMKGDATQDSGGGGSVLGIPKALSSIVVDLTGRGDHSATGRSEGFIPNPKAKQ
jgi:hypothetical protein